MEIFEEREGLNDTWGRFPLQGLLYYPAEVEGERTAFRAPRRMLQDAKQIDGVPLVILAHGEHSSAWMIGAFNNPRECILRGGNQANCVSSADEAPDGFIALPSYRGYDYIQASLAQHGIASLSLNFTRIDRGAPWGGRRYRLILAALSYLRQLPQGARPLGGNDLDLTRIGLFGHSRGGGAVVDAAEFIRRGALSIGKSSKPTSPPPSVGGVVTLCPTDQTLGPPPATSDYPFLSMVASEDEDISDAGEFVGPEYYDLKAPTPWKAQIYMRGANHKSFNRYWAWYWSRPGQRGPTMLSDAMHEKMASAYVCSFFRSCLNREVGALGVLTGSEIPEGISSTAVEVSFEASAPATWTIDDFEESGIETNALGLPNAATPSCREVVFAVGRSKSTLRGGVSDSSRERPWPYGEEAEVYALGHDSRSPIDGFTKGLVIEGIGELRSPLPGPTDLLEREVWLRAALVPLRSDWRDAQAEFGFRVGLEDLRGRVAWASSSTVVHLMAAHARRRPDGRYDIGFQNFIGYRRRAIPRTVRFPARCFVADSAQFDRTKVTAIRVRTVASDAVIAFDDLQLVHPERLPGLLEPRHSLIEGVSAPKRGGA